MALDMFLVFDHDDLKGETRDAAFAEEGGIDILAWSWGLSQSASSNVGSRRAARANVQDISLTNYVDKASPNLMLFCCMGTRIPKATLTVRRAGESPFDYLIVEMTNVSITSVSTGGSGGEDRLTENVSLNFEEVRVTYIEQRPDGTPGAKPQFGWHIAANRKV